MNFTIEQEQEADGRWLAEVPELPGVLAYGATLLEAVSKVEILALRVIAERLEDPIDCPPLIAPLIAIDWDCTKTRISSI